MEYYLPTYEECVDACLDDLSPFYQVKNKIDDYLVCCFNYRLLNPSDLNKDWKKELRGITYVFNNDGSLYKRFILLEKFFNLNQTEESMYSLVSEYEIENINNKEDGSICTFIELPNGKIVGKSKTGFDNDQAIMVNEIYRKNEEINKFVNWCLKNDIIPIFEYVSYLNKIVLIYKNTELILLRLRDNKTGQYLDISDFSDKIGNIKISNFENMYTLDEIIQLSKTLENKEGWVIRFTNGRMIKIKTEWYLEMHKLHFDILTRENELIKLIIDNQIDDILPNLDSDDPIISIVNEITLKLRKFSNLKIEKILDLYDNYLLIDDIKMFVSLNINHPEFSLLMCYIKNPNYDNLVNIVNNFILKKTNKLFKARDFLNEII